jgi:hypothetical protein
MAAATGRLRPPYSAITPPVQYTVPVKYAIPVVSPSRNARRLHSTRLAVACCHNATIRGVNATQAIAGWP